VAEAVKAFGECQNYLSTTEMLDAFRYQNCLDGLRYVFLQSMEKRWG
jgi:hypothetical protein